jgi:hypothetical protein
MVLLMPVMISPFFAVSTFGAMFLHIPFTALVKLINDITSSDKLEPTKEYHLKDGFL